ncbi:MAG: hypothetical protein BMS9Abin05_0412 [Rhodothermia bacterium]|nr:MAG: hypothetical protein BMS9Abin05_0412 [Rhodothermia bacterium]
MNPQIDSPPGFSPKHRSGIDVIDDTWGGLYRGGAYLVYGQEMSGRGLLAFMLCQTGVSQQEKTLLISSDRQKDLFILAASIGFDLRAAHEAGSIRLMRVPSLVDIRHENDENVAQALTDLVDIIVRFQPTRVVMNDFIPFISFQSFRRFQSEFIRFLERVDALKSTIILVMPEPGNNQSRRVIEFMGLQMTGSIHIELAEQNPRSTKRRISLIPHIGHIRHRVVDYWDLEDIVDDAADDSLDDAVHEDRPSISERVPESSRDDSVDEPLQHPDSITLSVSQSPDLPDITDRASFQERLQNKYDQPESEKEPFLLLAMRMDRGSENAIRPFDFDFLMDLVQIALRPKDDMLADPGNERLVVCLADSSTNEAQEFFARLKTNLRKESPQRADHLLHSVAAIVVPNGTPFQSAEEFLQYALDNNK